MSDLYETPRQVRLKLKREKFKLTPYYISMAKAYWREGKLNTQEIADQVGVDEFVIYNTVLKGRRL